VRELHSTSLGVSVETPRGDIETLDPVAFAGRTGIAAPMDDDSMALRGLRLAVDDLAALARRLEGAGIAADRRSGALIVPPAAAFGATLMFEQGPRR
jgi:hypothetical protein